MTIAAARTQARRYSRVSSTQASDAQLNLLMQDAIDEFATDARGFPTEAYLSIAARFDTKTNFAVRVTITGGSNPMVATDVLLTGTARANTTGTIVASDFEATLQAATSGSETVTWADFAFTIDTLDATSITFAAPTTVTYVDARELLGLPASPTLSDFKFTGDFPENCTMEATIPSDAIKVERVEWDQYKLEEGPPDYFMSPQATGDPLYYRIRGREIRLSPTPTSQDLFHIEYKGSPAALVFSGYQESGLNGISDEANTGIAAQGWKYKIAINGSDATEYDITTTGTDTYAALVTLMNAQNTGATWSLEGGDLRLTSDAVDGVSTIAVTAGASVDLLAALSITMETAVAGDTDLPTEIPGIYQQYVTHLTASKLLEETQEKLSDKEYMKYLQGVRKYKAEYHSRNTSVLIDRRAIRLPKVVM